MRRILPPLLVLAVLFLGACGQKGPLYRADESAQVVPPSETTPGSTGSSKKRMPVFPPAPQSQKNPPATPTQTPAPTDPTPAPPAVDPDRPATPPPGR